MAMQAPGYGESRGRGPRVSQSLNAPVRQSPDVPEEAFGGGRVSQIQQQGAARVGEAAGQALGAMERIGLQARDDADRAIVMERNLAAEKLRDQVQQESRGLYGFDVLKKQPELLEKFRAAAQKVGEDLTPRQAQLYNSLVASHANDLEKDIGNYGVDQAEKRKDDVAGATIYNHQVDAARNPFNKGRIQESRDLALIEQDRFLRGRGIRPEGDTKAVYDAHKLELTSKLHMGVVQARMDANSPMQAATYFEANKDEIDPKYHVQIRSQLGNDKRRAQSQQIVDDLMRRFDNYGAAESSIKELTKGDADLREAVEERAWRQYELKKKTDAEATDRFFLSNVEKVKASKSLDGIRPSDLAGMDKDQQKAMRFIADRAQGLPVPPKPELYQEYMRMLPGQIGRMSASDLAMKVEPFLTESQFKEVSDYWAKARNPDPRSQAEARSVFNDKELMFQAFSNAQVAGSKKGMLQRKMKPSTAEAFADFSAKADSILMQFENEKGRKPSDAEKKQIMDQMVVDVVTPRWGFIPDKHERAYEVLPEGSFLSDIPVAERAAIIKAREKANLPVTEEAIRRMYMEKQNRGQ